MLTAQAIRGALPTRLLYSKTNPLWSSPVRLRAWALGMASMTHERDRDELQPLDQTATRCEILGIDDQGAEHVYDPDR